MIGIIRNRSMKYFFKDRLQKKNIGELAFWSKSHKNKEVYSDADDKHSFHLPIVSHDLMKRFSEKEEPTIHREKGRIFFTEMISRALIQSRVH